MNRLIAKIDSLDKKMDSLLKDQIDIKKRLKNIELLSEINNDPNFSKVSFFN
jgi:prefoldin subunit 5